MGPRLAHAAVARVSGDVQVEHRGLRKRRPERRLRDHRGVLPFAVYQALSVGPPGYRRNRVDRRQGRDGQAGGASCAFPSRARGRLRCDHFIVEQCFSLQIKEVGMAGKAKFVFIASMDVDPAKEALFNEVYDTEHVPELLKVPGVLSIRRAVSVPLTMFLGGEKKTIVAEGEPRYSAYYELESAEVLTSSAWAKAVELGRWPGEVRPFTLNRRHVLRKIL